MTEQVAAGVVGVGSMGRNHARVYQELPTTELVGVADANAESAAEVADDYDTEAMGLDALFEAADVVSIAVPTRFHYETASKAIEAGVDLLVEKPFVERLEHGRILIERARSAGVTLQVGHIERFNPAVRTLADIVPDLDIIAVDAMRLGPPVDRDIEVSPVLDLMIHDIDVLCSIVDGEVANVSATQSNGDPYVTATVEFDNDVVGTLTASRITQRKIRRLDIVTTDRFVTVNYLDQSVEIFRGSAPEFIHEDSDVSYRHESVVERPLVEHTEPLKAEIGAFVGTIRNGAEPVVTPREGVEALRIAREIDRHAGGVEP